MKRMIKRGVFAAFFLASGLVVLVFALYSLMWALVSRQMDRQIEALWSAATEQGIEITGERPEVTGYPAPPTLRFSGRIRKKDTGQEWEIPELEVIGFFLPGQVVYAELPQGLTLRGDKVLENIANITAAGIRIRLPHDFPLSMNEETIRKWQKGGEQISIEWLSVLSPPLTLEGKGTAGLDNSLAPKGQIDVRIAGIDVLLETLVKDQVVAGRDAAILKGFASLLNERDEKTGKPLMATTFRIEERGIFLGPLKIGETAPLPWPWEEKRP